MPNMYEMMDWDFNIDDKKEEKFDDTSKAIRGEIDQPTEQERQEAYQELYNVGLISAKELIEAYPTLTSEELKQKRDEQEALKKEEKFDDTSKTFTIEELERHLDEYLQQQELEKWEENKFWRVVGEEDYGEGHIATHIEWPSNRLICMKDGDGNKHVLVPVFDIRQTGKTRKELVDMLIEDNKKQVHNNLKYIYTFSIEGYDHLFGMVAFSMESEPITDFFNNIKPLRECIDSCFKSY